VTFRHPFVFEAAGGGPRSGFVSSEETAMPPRTEIERRTAAPGLLGWLEREFSLFPGLRGFDTDRIMRCEEYQEPGRLVVRAELPGVDPDKDVEVTVADGMLKIQAHRREEHKDRRRTEFFYGEMVRTLMLPTGSEEKEITATYKDGILEVVVPIDTSEPTATTTVPITRMD
jgi:HSP20 family molecular chaperone IbpA